MTDPKQLSGAALAYLGDAVIEVLVRQYLLSTGVRDAGTLNRMALAFVPAVKQSDAVERILPLLTEEETDAYRRGRNASGIAAPKSATVGAYRRATGMEALFAYLHLLSRTERIDELFRAAYGIGDGEKAEKEN